MTEGTTRKEAGSTGDDETTDAAHRFIENLRENEMSAMEAVRRFVDTVNDSFPDVGEDGPRRRIIDAAFKMAEQIVGAGNQLAINLVELSEDALEGLAEKGDAEQGEVDTGGARKGTAGQRAGGKSAAGGRSTAKA
jgi:hypothetical protein